MNIWPIALSPITATANQRASWLPAHTPAAASSRASRRLLNLRAALGDVDAEVSTLGFSLAPPRARITTIKEARS
jgi:hypothetical protein